MSRLGLACLIAVALAAGWPAAADAAGPRATTMRIALPPQAQLGGAAQVQAQLVDAAGAPVADALVVFNAKLSFLQASGDVTLADAKTDKAGIASAEIDLRSEGVLEIAAVFAGNAAYAPSSATGTIDVAGSSQLYAQNAGVRIPGFNEAPAEPGSNAALLPGLSALWPRLSGWPVALVLMIVWSVYGTVVVILFRITAASRRTP